MTRVRDAFPLIQSAKAEALAKFYKFYPDAVDIFEAESCRYCYLLVLDIDLYRKMQKELPDYLYNCESTYYVSISNNRHFRIFLLRDPDNGSATFNNLIRDFDND